MIYKGSTPLYSTRRGRKLEKLNLGRLRRTESVDCSQNIVDEERFAGVLSGLGRFSEEFLLSAKLYCGACDTMCPQRY